MTEKEIKVHVIPKHIILWQITSLYLQPVLPSFFFILNVKNQTTYFDLGTFRPDVRCFIHDAISLTDITSCELREIGVTKWSLTTSPKHSTGVVEGLVPRASRFRRA